MQHVSSFVVKPREWAVSVVVIQVDSTRRCGSMNAGREVG